MFNLLERRLLKWVPLNCLNDGEPLDDLRQLSVTSIPLGLLDRLWQVTSIRISFQPLHSAENISGSKASIGRHGCSFSTENQCQPTFPISHHVQALLQMSATVSRPDVQVNVRRTIRTTVSRKEVVEAMVSVGGGQHLQPADLEYGITSSNAPTIELLDDEHGPCNGDSGEGADDCDPGKRSCDDILIDLVHD